MKLTVAGHAERLPLIAIRRTGRVTGNLARTTMLSRCPSVMLTCWVLMAASAVGGQETGADPFKGFGIHARQAREKAKALGLALDYDTPPKAVKLRAPKYPEIAPGRRAQGTVLLMIVIDSTGHVPQAEVLESIPALDAAALKCVASWRFKPALKNGQPVSTLAISPVTFRVER